MKIPLFATRAVPPFPSMPTFDGEPDALPVGYLTTDENAALVVGRNGERVILTNALGDPFDCGGFEFDPATALRHATAEPPRFGLSWRAAVTCPRCSGHKEIAVFPLDHLERKGWNEPCPTCGGKGVVPAEGATP